MKIENVNNVEGLISALKRLTRKGRIGFSGRRPYQLKVKALPNADDVPDVGQGLH